jgi:hypothetical protein
MFSHYCPLDLYSGERPRMEAAVQEWFQLHLSQDSCLNGPPSKIKIAWWYYWVGDS